MRVLLGDAGVGVEHQHDDVGVLDGLQRFHHRKFLDGFEHLAAAPYAGRVDQRVAAPVLFEIEVDRVPRGAGLVECDHSLLAQQRIDQRRLAHVGPADHRHLDRLVRAVGRFLVRR